MRARNLSTLAVFIFFVFGVTADLCWAGRYVDNPDGTVTDSQTKLIWQKADDGVLRNWDDAYQHCESMPGGGWRIPRIDELRTIVDYTRYDPTAIDPVFHCQPGTYWSGSTSASPPDYAWYLYFRKGLVGWTSKATPYYVRCVKGGPYWSFDPSEHLEQESENTTKDTFTNLEWQRSDDGTQRTWNEAHAYCDESSLDEFQDWRLPSIQELQTIIDYTTYDPALTTEVFIGQSGAYWSDTKYAASADNSWAAHFDYGGVWWNRDDVPFYVRCVRGGSSTLTITLDHPEAGLVAGPGIKCGTDDAVLWEDCQYTYAIGSVVKLTATANDGWTFFEWDDGTESYLNYLNPRAVKMSGSKNLNAKFALAQPCAGWSSQTGYKWADTEVRRKIVRLAKDAIGRSSGQSTTLIPPTAKGGWLTDVADGDGRRMQNAISIYDQWKRGVEFADYTEIQIRQLMTKAFAKSSYTAENKSLLIDKIISVYASDTTIPTNDEQTLQYLNIRKQCLEWAMTIADKAGGVAKNYKNVNTAVAKESVRPGMGYYHLGHHAMIIIDVYYNNEGVATKLKVAESNYAARWNNPPGDIPWKREIGSRDKVKFGHTIVDYDK